MRTTERGREGLQRQQRSEPQGTRRDAEDCSRVPPRPLRSMLFLMPALGEEGVADGEEME
jgi:hypothetical protein